MRGVRPRARARPTSSGPRTLTEAGLLTREDDPTATRGRRGKYRAPPADELHEADGESDEVSVLAGAH